MVAWAQGKSAEKVHSAFGQIPITERSADLVQGKEQTMSRWAEVDALKANINTAFWSEIEKIIDSAPSLDLVRCDECKYKQHCGKAVEHTTYEPTSVTIECKSIDFCSYGRRENE